MIGIMLLGAWFLVHQQCCSADMRTLTRNTLVDPLSRRSPLEKNFMRYGRAWPLRESVSSNSILWPLGEASDTVEDWGKLSPREVRGMKIKDNLHMRFGRSMDNPFAGPKDIDAAWESMLSKDMFSHDGPPLSNSYNHNAPFQNKVNTNYPEGDLLSAVFPRIARNQKNFIRFGRSNTYLNKKKYSELNNSMRFGRALDRPSKGKEVNHDDNSDSDFSRFAKSPDLTSPVDVAKEARFIRSNPVGTKCGDSEGSCRCFDKQPLNFDPTSIVAPEFSLLPNLASQTTPSKKSNFIRLG